MDTMDITKSLSTKVNQQTGISIYTVKPSTLTYDSGMISLVRDDGSVVFSKAISEITKVKNYGDFLYLWFGKKSYTINFGRNEDLTNEKKTVLKRYFLLGNAGSASTIPAAAKREADNRNIVESWMSLFRSQGVQAESNGYYNSKWMKVALVAFAIITLLIIFIF